MTIFNRRDALVTLTAGSIAAAASSKAFAADVPQPRRAGAGGDDPGPRNVGRDIQNPDILNQPITDAGTLPNLRFSFADAPTK